MASKVIYSVVAVVGIVTASTLAWWYQNSPKSAEATQAAGGAPGGPKMVGVEVTQVQKLLLRDDAEAVGTLRSRQNVMLRPEVAGRILSLGFADGARVSAGQVLVQLDDTLQRAEVQQSLAQASVARANYKRNQDLVAQNFIAQRALDESAAALQVADAQLGLSCARLERMRIVAPFGGVVGIRNINIGDYVKDGADLINLEDIGLLYVDYRLPERYQSKVQPGQVVEIKLDALPGRLFKAKVEALDPLIDANGPGELIAPAGARKADAPAATASNPMPAAAKPATQTSPVPAPAKSRVVGGGVNLPSPQSLGCPPSMFNHARVMAVFATKPNALVVPEEAIVPQGGKQFVIRAVAPADLPASPASAASAPALPPGTELVSRRVEVKLGIRRAGQVEVTEGLEEGDVVVVAGQQRLQKDGAPLRVIQLGRGAANPASAAASGADPAASHASNASAAQAAASR